MKNTDRERKESSPNPALTLAKTTPEERFRDLTKHLIISYYSSIPGQTHTQTNKHLLPNKLINTVEEKDTIRKLTTAVMKQTKTRKLFINKS